MWCYEDNRGFKEKEQGYAPSPFREGDLAGMLSRDLGNLYERKSWKVRGCDIRGSRKEMPTYFHLIANIRRQVNTIHSLSTNERTRGWYSSIQHLPHFHDLFGYSNMFHLGILFGISSTDLDLLGLEADLSEKEIKRVVCELGVEKAPDRTSLFFRFFWQRKL